MNLAERQKHFLEAVKKRRGATKQTKISALFGVSNSAKIIEGGIQLGVSNLDTANASSDFFILACVLNFPPEDEVYFAVIIRDAKDKLLERLAAMKALGASLKASSSAPAAESEDDAEAAEAAESSSSIKYSDRNNLVVVYIAAQDGKIYLRNAKFWSTLKVDMSAFAPPVDVDAIDVAIYPPSVSARRSLLARDFVGYLGSLVGREKVHELSVWPDAASVSPDMRRMPLTLPIAAIESAIKALGGYYPGGEVRRLHAALNFLDHKHFVILSGLSGTGKTQLALKYALAVHGITAADAEDPFLIVCPVRPEWTDPTGLTGYYDVLSNRYIVPPFLEAVLLATAHRDSPVFVILDEMNLARVEYYLSDVLSCIESQKSLQLHSSGVPLEGSTGTPVRAALPVPRNLFLIGTINIDETTNPVSDKVLDRAVIIDMSTVDLPGFLDDLQTRHAALKPARDASGPKLEAVHQLMAGQSLGFGYRVTEEAIRYHAFAADKLAEDSATITDALMVQKVLVKLRGSERQRSMLTELRKTLAGLPRSEAFLDRLLSDLDEFGSFQATR